MAREGIEMNDIKPKYILISNFYRPFDQYMKECHGNEKIANIRYEYKEAERQSKFLLVKNY